MFIITGGGSGIGRALALTLANLGKTVLIVGRRETPLQETAVLSANIQYLCADVSTDYGLESIKNHVENASQISALVNNAGTLEPLLPLKAMQPNQWQQTLNTNLNAALFLPQKLQRQLQHGRVLNIGSGAAYIAIKGWAAYCCSKAALAMLTRCWQLESDNIAFANVMPGIIDTAMQDLARMGQNMDESQVDFYARLKQQGRLITPETVATFLAWLLLEVDTETYVSKEWDIYDTSHHAAWLQPWQQVLHWDF